MNTPTEDSWHMAAAQVRSLLAQAEVSPGVLVDEASRLKHIFALYKQLHPHGSVAGMVKEVYRTTGRYHVSQPKVVQALQKLLI